MLKLYNSLGRKIEEFSPIDEVVRVYSCGPTVYDNIHIGNLSSFIFADNITRALKLSGYKVKHVMNITDINDKIIERSKIDFPEQSPELAVKNLATVYENSFKDDVEKTGIKLKNINFIKATESIDDMQKLIRELINKKFAYIADDGIYFSIEAYKKSGKVYGQLLELDTGNTSKARINNDEYDKHSVHDFALWKFMRDGEPAWSFEINDKDYLGRPGWHIECSAMSSLGLGQPFDIHTGGIDLIFPHHENEIAQSTAGKTNNIYAKFFAHNEHLLIEKKKMSKSLGNIYNLKDVIERGYDPLVFRLLVLQSHYRKQSYFSWDLLDAANNRFRDLQNFAALVHQIKPTTNKLINFSEARNDIKKAFLDDLNIPKALASLSDLQNIVMENFVSINQAKEFKDFLVFIDDTLGLNLVDIDDIEESVKKLIQKRQIARDNKDWESSDSIRDKLIELGIGLRDTYAGQIWYRI